MDKEKDTKVQNNDQEIKHAILVEITEHVKEITDITKSTVQRLKKENNINISHEGVIPTIWYEFQKQLWMYLIERRDDNPRLNFMGWMTYQVDSYVDQNGDMKYNMQIIPDQPFKLAVKNDRATNNNDDLKEIE